MAQEEPGFLSISQAASLPTLHPDFLVGGGEMGERIREKDWSSTPLGPIEQWPQSLRTVVRIMLTSRQPIWIGWGPELIKLYNDPYKTIVGGKHPQALGQPAAVVWREIWDAIGPRLQTVMQENEGTYDEALLLIMERYGYQEETYYTFSYSPVPGDQGGVGGIICANTDDTARVIGERQLKLLRALASEAAAAQTVEEACRLSANSLQHNPYDLPFAMIYLLDQEQQMVYLAGTSGIEKGHPAVPETVALSAQALWPFADVLKEQKMCVIAGLEEMVNDLPTGAWKRPPHQAVAVPITLSGQTGKAGILIVGLNPFRLFDEAYQGFIDLVASRIAASITDAQAYGSEERFRALADNIPNLAWMAESDGRIYWYNSRWYEYTGTTPEQMVGWGWQAVHDPRVLPGVLERWRSSLQSGVAFEMTFPLKGADGLFRPFLTRVVPIRDARGNVVQWFGTNTDVTEQKKLEQQKDEFIAIASHELKTPVTSLKVYTQLLERRFRRTGSEQESALLKKMDAQLDKLTDLIKDLLDVSRIEGGQLLFHYSSFDFNELIEEVIEETQRMAVRHTIAQELTSSVVLNGDRERIGQVLTNLLTNAIKYSPQADTIVVKTAHKDELIITTVQDFGIGIAREKQSRIFERFFRIEDATQATYPGLGLGLYISAEFVKRHGGAIWVESEEGKGATFSFSLPLSNR
jgi:PAS domain S-box-containing protein